MRTHTYTHHLVQLSLWGHSIDVLTLTPDPVTVFSPHGVQAKVPISTNWSPQVGLYAKSGSHMVGNTCSQVCVCIKLDIELTSIRFCN